jgi:hypothetical protein
MGASEGRRGPVDRRRHEAPCDDAYVNRSTGVNSADGRQVRLIVSTPLDCDCNVRNSFHDEVRLASLPAAVALARSSFLVGEREAKLVEESFLSQVGVRFVWVRKED